MTAACFSYFMSARYNGEFIYQFLYLCQTMVSGRGRISRKMVRSAHLAFFARLACKIELKANMIPKVKCNIKI